MISAIRTATPAAATGTTGGTGTTSGSGSAGSTGMAGMANTDAFMKLLVTQLRNQDPMSPLQPYELAAQLAQFTSVEQLGNIQTALTSQNQNMQLNTMVGQTALATSMIGRHVYADGDQVTVTAGASSSVRVAIGGEGGTATLHLLDANGKEVTSRDLGKLVPGTQTVALPKDLPAGDWHYSISCTGNDGKAVTVATTTSGVVTGVSFTSSGVLLRIGGVEVPLEKVQDVDAATPNP